VALYRELTVRAVKSTFSLSVHAVNLEEFMTDSSTERVVLLGDNIYRKG
jgi:hypothetical protein